MEYKKQILKKKNQHEQVYYFCVEMKILRRCFTTGQRHHYVKHLKLRLGFLSEPGFRTRRCIWEWNLSA